jgi:Tol biopolymer transport system component
VTVARDIGLAACALALAGGSSAGWSSPSVRPGSIVFAVSPSLPAFKGDERCWGLYAVDSDGGGLRRIAGWSGPLVHISAPNHPVFSPDGTNLAFTVFGDGKAEVWVADTASGSATRLTAFPWDVQVPYELEWSPGGRFLLVPAFRRDRAELRRVDVTTGRAGRLRAGRAPSSGTWSPAGSAVAYGRHFFLYDPRKGDAEQGSSLMAMDAAGGPARLLARSAGEPEWAPDGRSILFFRPPRVAAQGTSDLRSVGRDGSRTRRLARSILYRGPPSVVFSPSGRQVLVLRQPRVRTQITDLTDGGDAFVLDPDTRRLRLFARQVAPLDWAPDGRILFLRGRRWVVGVYTSRVDGARKSLVAVTDGAYGTVAWQPRPVTLNAIGAPFEPRPEWEFCTARLAGVIRAHG